VLRQERTSILGEKSLLKLTLSQEQNPIILSEQNGVLMETVLNSRVMLFSCSAYRAMCDELYDQFQSGASVILYRMGKGYARKLSAAIPKFGSTKEGAISGFEQIAKIAGWGEMHCRVVDESRAECVVHHSPFVLRRTGIGHISCYFLSGVLASIATDIYNKRFESQEIECESSGSRYCRFNIEANEIMKDT
jgi:predicted hydrocarbon binding protein